MVVYNNSWMMFSGRIKGFIIVTCIIPSILSLLFNPYTVVKPYSRFSSRHLNPSGHVYTARSLGPLYLTKSDVISDSLCSEPLHTYFTSIRGKSDHVSHFHRSQESSKTALAASPFDEDLPNIFGINPLEAAAIFGVLYYFYGPETLSEYARAAGRFVSTYLPILQQITGEVINEFKDYFEEDKERELLKTQGFDISMIPRRSTNIFERLQVYLCDQ